MRIPFAIAPREARLFDVTGIGQNSVDLVAMVGEFPRNNSKLRIQRFARLPGGQVASAMVSAARLGLRARYVGRFGTDELGRLARESLSAEGVDLSAAESLAGVGNRFAIVLVEAGSGHRTVLWDRNPALALRGMDVPAGVVESARALLVDCEDVEASTEAARRARSAGTMTVIDIESALPGTSELLRQIDVIIASEGFPEQATGVSSTGKALAALYREYQPVLACVTLGSQGSLALCGGSEIRTRAFMVPCVDTTGAGDAFRGGFIAGLLENPDAPAADVLVYANAVAALKCRVLGARDGLPRPDDVRRLMGRRSTG